MKCGFIISMYDELSIVHNTILNVKNYFKETEIVLVHSDNKEDVSYKDIVDSYICLPNLAETYTRYEIPARSISRNYSVGYAAISKKLDCLVFLTGDTHIFDASNIEKRFLEMQKNNYMAFVSKAVGQDFHSSDANPAAGISGGRYQNDNTTDIMPQFIIFNKPLITSTSGFTDIPVTNKFTTEQCLGDRLTYLLKTKDNFHKYVGILNKNNINNPYSYSDGIRFHATKNGKPGR